MVMGSQIMLLNIIMSIKSITLFVITERALTVKFFSDIVTFIYSPSSTTKLYPWGVSDGKTLFEDY